MVHLSAIKSGYFNGPWTDKNSPTVRAEKISKTAWMDLYFDLYQQTHGEPCTQSEVLADAEKRLKILKQNGIRR